MKKIISFTLAALLLVTACFTLASCGDDKKTIGIIQFGSHGSLNNCYDGIIAGLNENGINADDYNIELANSNFDASVAQAQAQLFVNKGASVIIAIATPSAIAAANAAANANIPVVYCAITDGTVMDNFENITGSSDVPNFAKQLELVTAFMGKSDLKIGVLYSTEEASSPYQVTKLKEAAQAYTGMSVEDKVVSDITTINTAVNDLLGRGVDCFVNLLDNTIVGKLESNILPLTNDAGIPVFGSEVEQVKVGCAASSSIDYIDVGRSAGKAAAQILGGTAASTIPEATISEPTNYYNSEVCNALHLTVPTTVAATDVKFNVGIKRYEQ